MQSGTYLEKVNVNEKLTLRGIGNPVVNAGGSGSAITLSVNGIRLEGFTATGGLGGVSRYDTRAGIKVTSKNNILIGNNVSNNGIGIELALSSNNKIYNNIFNNTNNFEIRKSNINKWNTKKRSGKNIIGGPYLGGNFWGKPDGTGFSQTCTDANNDGICDSIYVINGRGNVDYLPLAISKIK